MKDSTKKCGIIGKGSLKSVSGSQGKHLKPLGSQTNKMNIPVIEAQKSAQKTPSGSTECDKESIWTQCWLCRQQVGREGPCRYWE